MEELTVFTLSTTQPSHLYEIKKCTNENFINNLTEILKCPNYIIFEPVTLTICPDEKGKLLKIDNIDINVRSIHYSFLNDFYGNYVMYKYRLDLLTERPTYAFLGNAKRWLLYAQNEIITQIRKKNSIYKPSYFHNIITDQILYISLWKRFLLFGTEDNKRQNILYNIIYF